MRAALIRGAARRIQRSEDAQWAATTVRADARIVEVRRRFPNAAEIISRESLIGMLCKNRAALRRRVAMHARKIGAR